MTGQPDKVSGGAAAAAAAAAAAVTAKQKQQGHPLRLSRHKLSRSITEITWTNGKLSLLPWQQQQQQQQQPRHHHQKQSNGNHYFHHLGHSKHHDHGRHERNSPPSATPTLFRASLDLPRSEASASHWAIMNNFDQSRRNSVQPVGTEEIRVLADTAMAARKEKLQQEEGNKTRTVTATAAAEQNDNGSSSDGLEKTLLSLYQFSNTAATRLDDAYYAVLERLGDLQSTLYTMKALAAAAQETAQTFTADSQQLVSEIDSQLTALGQFDDQQKRIELLRERIHDGREKAQRLSDRVDAVRNRVDRWERADREWQEKTRRRLKVLWIIMSAVALVMILLFVGAQYASSSQYGNTTVHDGRAIRIPPKGSNRTREAPRLGDEVRAAFQRDREQLDEQALHALDEL